MYQCSDSYDDRTESDVDLFAGRNRRDGIRMSEKTQGTEYGDVSSPFPVKMGSAILVTLFSIRPLYSKPNLSLWQILLKLSFLQKLIIENKVSKDWS